MNRIAFTTALTLAAATPFIMHGQNSSGSENMNRISFGARFGMNFKASFNNSAPGFPGANTGPAIGGVDHSYEDGYVLVDSSGNAGGLTWNWGYENDSQVVGDTMQFHSTQSSPLSLPAKRDVTGDPQYGLELIYQISLGRLPGESSGRWGLEIGFGYTDLCLRDDRRASGLNTVTTDSFSLNGVLPPGEGYEGTFGGPGALLGDTPTRTIANEIATLTSKQKLSGQLYTIRVGPFVEWDFTSQLSISGSAGMTLAPAVVDFDFSETFSSAGSSQTVSGHKSKTDLLYGPFVSGKLNYNFTKSWGVYVGAQFQSLTDMKLKSGSHSAKLDPGATVYGAIGVVWSF